MAKYFAARVTMTPIAFMGSCHIGGHTGDWITRTLQTNTLKIKNLSTPFPKLWRLIQPRFPPTHLKHPIPWFHLQNDLYCVGWGIKTLLTHSLVPKAKGECILWTGRWGRADDAPNGLKQLDHRKKYSRDIFTQWRAPESLHDERQDTFGDNSAVSVCDFITVLENTGQASEFANATMRWCAGRHAIGLTGEIRHHGCCRRPAPSPCPGWPHLLDSWPGLRVHLQQTANTRISWHSKSVNQHGNGRLVSAFRNVTAKSHLKQAFHSHFLGASSTRMLLMFNHLL